MKIVRTIVIISVLFVINQAIALKELDKPNKMEELLVYRFRACETKKGGKIRETFRPNSS